jgi:hypothetical protein
LRQEIKEGKQQRGGSECDGQKGPIGKEETRDGARKEQR